MVSGPPWQLIIVIRKCSPSVTRSSDCFFFFFKKKQKYGFDRLYFIFLFFDFVFFNIKCPFMTTVSKKVEVSVSGLDLARRPHGASSGSAEGQTVQPLAPMSAWGPGPFCLWASVSSSVK